VASELDLGPGHLRPSVKEELNEIVKELYAEDKPRRGVCKHGTARGWHCWQCGGKAIIEGEKEPEPAKQPKKKKRKLKK
jgi:hypothetical protein